MKFNELNLSDCTFTRTDGNKKLIWEIPTLLQYVKEQKYKTFDLPLDGVDLSSLFWAVTNTRDFIIHYKRCEKANLKYPILIDDLGTICDGWHRVVKSILEGKRYIKAIRIEKMPFPACEEEVR